MYMYRLCKRKLRNNALSWDLKIYAFWVRQKKKQSTGMWHLFCGLFLLFFHFFFFFGLFVSSQSFLNFFFTQHISHPAIYYVYTYHFGCSTRFFVFYLINISIVPLRNLLFRTNTAAAFHLR